MAKSIPDGYTAVTPYLLVKDVRAQIDFLTRAFGATVNMKMDLPDGTVGHADMSVFGAHVMMGYGGEKHGEMPAMLYLYVADADAVHAQAIAAGATLLAPVTNQFYGDRAGSVKDANGNVWWIATHGEELAPDEIRRRMAVERQK